jgi:RimJ/RimL family protein N-acetyltransferase
MSYSSAKYPCSNAAPVLSACFAEAREDVYSKKLSPEDALLFLQMHTETREQLPPENQTFMKELDPELLAYVFEKGMPVIGRFENGQMISGCIVLYPSDPVIATYLEGYDFNGKEDRSAVISAVWTKKDHERKGHSQQAVESGINCVLEQGKTIIHAKVDKKNKGSICVFRKLGFDVNIEGNDPAKLYPRLERDFPACCPASRPRVALEAKIA